MAKAKTLKIDATFCVKTRIDQELNQAQFWHKYGITQSGGSRYESGGRKIPKAVRMLIALDLGIAACSEISDSTLVSRV